MLALLQFITNVMECWNRIVPRLENIQDLGSVWIGEIQLGPLLVYLRCHNKLSSLSIIWWHGKALSWFHLLMQFFNLVERTCTLHFLCYLVNFMHLMKLSFLKISLRMELYGCWRSSEVWEVQSLSSRHQVNATGLLHMLLEDPWLLVYWFTYSTHRRCLSAAIGGEFSIFWQS